MAVADRVDALGGQRSGLVEQLGRGPLRRSGAARPRGPAPDAGPPRRARSARPATVSSASSVTTAPTPHIGSSPWRRAISTNADPVRSRGGRGDPQLHGELVGRETGGERTGEEVVGVDEPLAGGGCGPRPARRGRAAPWAARRRDRRRRRCRPRCPVVAPRRARRTHPPRPAAGRGRAPADAARTSRCRASGADADAVLVRVDRVEAGDAVDVDQDRRGGGAGVHQPHQALPTGQHAGLGAVLSELGEGFLDAGGRQIGECGRFHSTPPCAGR